MKLALTLGWKSVGLMLQGLTYKELLQWIEFFSIEPFPEDRADFRNGILCAVIANVNRKKGSKVFMPKDFIVDIWQFDEPKTSTPETMMQNAFSIHAALGGKTIRREDANK